MKNWLASGFFTALLSVVTVLPAYALGDQWYIGIGGGGAYLQPNPEQPGVNPDEKQGTSATVFLGADLDRRSSAQLQLYSLGEATLTNAETVAYNAFDGSVVYRLYDSRDASLRRGNFGIALYGRFALGYIQRDTEVDLSGDADVYFGAGAGAELFFNNRLSMRLEGLYHDSDVATANLSLVARFGGVARPPLRSSPVQESLPAKPSIDASTGTTAQPQASAESSTTTETAIQDSDTDGIADAIDQCPGSRANYPVRDDGCALFNGVLSGIQFDQGTATLLTSSFEQLEFLANVLTKYPEARIGLLAHTDNAGTVKEQAVLTRSRLRTIGTYLIQQGVRSRQLVLRSFGGSKPIYDNASADGRAGNNRIEVIEHQSSQ